MESFGFQLSVYSVFSVDFVNGLFLFLFVAD